MSPSFYLRCVFAVILLLTARVEFCAAATYNVPPDHLPDQLNSGDTLNLLPGGIYYSYLEVGGSSSSPRSVTMNLDGGQVFGDLSAQYGSRVNVFSGIVHSNFTAFEGSEVSIYGGQFSNLSGLRGSKVGLHGTDFRIDGQPIEGLTAVGQSLQFDWNGGMLLSGVFADGTPFAFSPYGENFFAPGTLTLNLSNSAPNYYPTEIVASVDPVPNTLRAGQRLVADAYVAQSVLASHGSTIDVIESGQIELTSKGVVNVLGGEVNWATADDGAVFNISGGHIRSYLQMMPGSIANVTGGLISGGFVQGELNVTGGNVYDRLRVHLGGHIRLNEGTLYSINVGREGSLEVTQGLISNGISVTEGGIVRLKGGSTSAAVVYDSDSFELSGGTLGRLHVDDDGGATIVGGEFALDGVSIAGLDAIGDTLEIVVPESSALSGILADGTPFMFSAQDIASNWYSDSLAGTLRLRRSDVPLASPAELLASRDAIGSGIRRGQSLVVDASGVIGDDFGAGPGSAVRVVEGGDIGSNFEAVAAEIDVSGGLIRHGFDAAAGTAVRITGGEIFGGCEILNGSTLQQSGGTVHGLSVKPGGVAQVSGGTVGDKLDVDGGLAEISSGTIGTGARVQGGGQINISGGTFSGTIYAVDHGIIQVSGGRFVGQMQTYSGGEIHFNGGEALSGFAANVGSRVAIENGTIRGESVASGETSALFPSGGEVFIRGGMIDGRLTAQTRSNVEISGGVLADGFQANSFSNVLVVGGEFKLNGEPIAGLENVGSERQLELSGDSTLSGVLADGTPFAFQTGQSTSRADSFAAGTLRLKTAELPATGSRTIQASTDPLPKSIRGDERLIVDAGGRVDNNFMAGPGSQLEVREGGIVGRNLEAIGATVEIDGGEIGEVFDAYGGSTVFIRDGKVGYGLQAFAGSVVHISGGVVGPSAEYPGAGGYAVVAYRGSEVNVSGGDVKGLRPQPGSKIQVTGGRVGDYFQCQEETSVRLAGGAIGDHFYMAPNSQLRVVGGEFRINGEPISGLSELGDTLQVDVDPFSVLTGVFADGTPFSFAHADADYITPGTMTLEVAALPFAAPRHLRASVDEIPLGIRGPEVLDVDAGATVDEDFSAGEGSTVNIHAGGAVKYNFEANGGTVNLLGGTIHENFNAFEGSVVNIRGGSVGQFSDAFHGSTINLFQGELQQYFTAESGSTVNISGGTVGSSFSAYGGSKIQISGGTIDRDFRAFSESQVDVFGTEFFLDGVPVQNLELGQPLVISERDVMLTGRLADGSTFMFQLEDTYPFNWPYWYERPRNFFEATALLRLTQVHHPGDYNGDGRVTEADRAVWQTAMNSGDLAADGNYDRQITLDDLRIWEERLGTVYFGVPECSSVILAAVAVAWAGSIRRRRSTHCN